MFSIFQKCLAILRRNKDNSQHFVYVTNQGSNSISQYRISAHGSLVPAVPATIAAGTTPLYIASAPSGKYAYVANQGGNITIAGNLSAFARMKPGLAMQVVQRSAADGFRSRRGVRLFICSRIVVARNAQPAAAIQFATNKRLGPALVA
mgnify:CR=1 FL=1